jgi:hypothetical protein
VAASHALAASVDTDVISPREKCCATSGCMKRRKSAWRSVVLAFFFGGLGLFYFGPWPGVLGFLAASAAMALECRVLEWFDPSGSLIPVAFLATNALFIVPALQLCKRNNRQIPANFIEPTKKATPPIRKAVKIAIWLFVIDAFFLNQGILSGMFLAVLVIAFVPVTLWLILRKRRSELRLQISQFGIYAVMCLAVLSWVSLNNAMARRRAMMLGDACRQFHTKYNRYPDRLEELEPEFIPSIPVAKYAFMNANFFYLKSTEDPEVGFVELPPFGRRLYHVKSGNWGYID